MQTVVESYRNEDAVERGEEFREMKERRAQMCKELGLKAQAGAQEIADEAAVFYREITGYELMMWQRFLPTAYASWEDYQYDVIPEVALEDIRTAKSMKVFSSLEIWTPEVPERSVQRDDPMVVGITGVGRDRRFFPVVRWGAEKILSFEEIEREVARQLRIYASGKTLPETVIDHIVGAFRETGNVSRYQVSRVESGLMGRLKHCGERMYKVIWDDFTPERFKVCARCGHSQQVNY